MPKLKKYMTEAEIETANQIKADFGAALKKTQVMELLGVSQKTADKWLEDVDFIQVNGRKRYMAVDLAKKIEANRCRV